MYFIEGLHHLEGVGVTAEQVVLAGPVLQWKVTGGMGHPKELYWLPSCLSATMYLSVVHYFEWNHSLIPSFRGNYLVSIYKESVLKAF